MKFRKFDGTYIDDVAKYIRDYRYEHGYEETELYVGTDSQRRGKHTMISTVIVLYRRGKGGHIIHWTVKVPRIHQLTAKLWKEVSHTAEVIQHLIENGIKRKDLIVHIDVNPNPKWDSNVMYKASKGYIQGLGFNEDQVVTKPLSYVAMHVADKAARL